MGLTGNLVGGLARGLCIFLCLRGDFDPDIPTEELFLGEGIASEFDLK